MHCPVCKDTTLVMSERQGIEIDYCPQCRGVWLDRGELDKIIQRAVANMQEANPAAQPVVQPAAQPATSFQPAAAPHYQQPHYPPAQQPHGYPPAHGHHSQQHYHHKKKKSFWEELFDD